MANARYPSIAAAMMGRIGIARQNLAVWLPPGEVDARTAYLPVLRHDLRELLEAVESMMAETAGGAK